MKKAAGCLLLILAGLTLSFVVASYGWYELETSKAKESLLTFDFDSTEARLNGVQKYLNRGRDLPFLNSWAIDVDSKKSEVNYWRREYKALTAKNDIDMKALDSRLDFIKANSIYRQIELEKDRNKVLDGLDAAITGYLQVINQDDKNLNAVFNYEYLLRLRDNVVNKKMPLPFKGDSQKQQTSDQPGIHGQEGQQAKESGENKIKIHVPMGVDEIERNKGLDDAGKGEIKRKKG